MFSRYDVLSPSQVQDPVDRDNYPDPLSINYNNVKLTQLPGRTALSKVDLDRFWLFMTRQYSKVAEADDVLLIINDVPYVGMLQTGDFLYTPGLSDLYGVSNIAGLP